MKKILAVIGLSMAMSLTPLVYAQGNSDHHKQNGNSQGNGNGHGNGKAHGNPHNQAANSGWDSRDGWEYRTYGPNEGRPPGWSKGKKTGWGNCGMPPGQAKKYGCNTYVYQGRNYYYYQDTGGQIYVRRPSIDVDLGGVSVH